jgi:hypothetical protein
MPPIDALMAKASAYDGLHDPIWSGLARGYIESVMGAHPYHAVPAIHPVHTTSESLTAELTACLNAAEVFYVSPEMNALVTAAAESWPDDEATLPEDMPSPDGWMWIPGGLTCIDIRGSLLVTSAISWHIYGQTMNVTYWSDKRDDRPDIKAEPGHALIPRFTPWHEYQQKLGERLPKSLRMGTVLPPEVSNSITWAHRTLPNGHEQWMAHLPHEGWTEEQLQPRVEVDSIAAWLVSALRLMRQPLATVRRQGLPAGVRRDLRKRRFTFANKQVTVIEFRRPSGLEQHESTFEYSHRFLRRGHWRRQWYGSGDGRHQLAIWIHPSIVGPADKPFILRKHVNAFIR